MENFSFHKQGSTAWLAKGIKHQTNLPPYTLGTGNKNQYFRLEWKILYF